MNKKYTPISCEIYSNYELAIIRRCLLRVVWEGAGGIDRIETLKPSDLRTRRSAEFMIARNQLGHRRVLRLDRIKSAEIIQPN